MRAGALISAVAHTILLTLLLLGTAKPYDTAPPETVTVDLVPSEQAPPAPEKTEPQKSEPAKPEPAKPELTLSLPSFVPSPNNNDASAPSAPASAPAKAPPQPAAQRKAATPPPSPPAAPQRTASAPQASTPRASAPPAAAPPASAPAAAPAQVPPPTASAEDKPGIFDPAAIPMLMSMTPPPPATPAGTIGFDAAADTAANLSAEQIAAFKSHLGKCLKLPAGVDAGRNLKIVMRIFLKRDGALATDPMLVSGPALREGPLMMQAAVQALKQCQPYNFLPAEKYDEWKMLDVTLTPRDMAGG
jgi:hypothetical protein